MPLNQSAAQQAAQQIVSALQIPSGEQQTALDNWTQIVSAIYTVLVAQALVIPTALVAPPSGGPVAGIGNLQ